MASDCLEALLPANQKLVGFALEDKYQWANSLAPGGYGGNFTRLSGKCSSFIWILGIYCQTGISRVPRYPIDEKSKLINVWLGAVRQQAISWANLDPGICCHYGDVTMVTVALQITSLTIVYSIVWWDRDQRKHQSSASLAFFRGIHRSPVKSSHKWPVTRKMFPFDDVIMVISRHYTKMS